MTVAQLLVLAPVSLPEAIHRCYADDVEWEAHVRYRIEREVGDTVERWDRTHAAQDAQRLARDLDI